MIKVSNIKPPKIIQFLDGLTRSKGRLISSYVKDKELERELEHEMYSWANQDEIKQFKYVVDREKALNPYHIQSRKIEVCEKLLETMEYMPITEVKKNVKRKLKEMRQSGFPDGTVADKQNYIARKDAFELFLEVIK